MDDTKSEPLSPPCRAAQRRHLTILYSDLSDSTSLVGTFEPEQYLEVLRHLEASCSHVIAAHRGRVLQFRGDGALAIFGFPQAAEDDGRRATEAAIAVHQAIRQWRAPRAMGDLRLTMHSGIHSGLVLVVESDGTAEMSLIGEAVNVAARLSDAAGPDEILVSVTTLGAERHFFRTRDCGNLMLQGKVEAVPTCQVLGPSDICTGLHPFRRGFLRLLVGGSVAFLLFPAGLQVFKSGRVRRVSIIGPAGIGKTRLVEEFVRDGALEDSRVCRGYCDSTLGAEPLQPLLQMLRTLCRMEPGTALSEAALDDHLTKLPPDLALHARNLRLGFEAALSPPGRLDGQTPAPAAGAMVALFAALARDKPLVLVIDDWHWVDDATRAVMGALTQLGEAPVLLVATSRERSPRDAVIDDAHVIELGALSDDEATAVIQSLRPGADPFTVKRIRLLSGGNPLFIEELCRAWGDDDRLAHGGRLESRMAWLSTLIEARLARLSVEQAGFVRTAAVIGTVVPAWLIEQVSAAPDAEDLLQQLTDADVLYAGEVPGTLRFKHGITREVVYDSVGLEQRQRLHRAIAEYLEQRRHAGAQDDLLEMLAYHWRASADHEKAAWWAEQAGDKAMRAAALDRARRQYSEALTALDELPPSDAVYQRWMSIMKRVGVACVYDPLRNQLDVFRRAVVLAGERHDEPLMAWAEYWLGYVNYGLGELPAAIDHSERALAHCTQAAATAVAAGDQALAAELRALTAHVLATLGQSRAAAGDHEPALVQLDRSLAIKREYRRNPRAAVGSAYALACKGAVLGDQGRFDAAHDCLAEALEAARDGNHAMAGSILNWQSAVYAWQGRWEDALQTAALGQEAAERIESLYVLGISRALMGYTRWMMDRTVAAVDVIVRATSWLDSRDKRLFISLPYAWIAGAYAELGREEDARIYAARVLRRARRHDRLGTAAACHALASISGVDRHRAARYLARALQAARARQSAREEAITILHQAELDARHGDRAAAATRAVHAQSQFMAMAMPWHAERARQVASDAGGGADPGRRLSEAFEQQDVGGRPGPERSRLE